MAWKDESVGIEIRMVVGVSEKARCLQDGLCLALFDGGFSLDMEWDVCQKIPLSLSHEIEVVQLAKTPLSE